MVAIDVRQRWRVFFARAADHAATPQREIESGVEEAIRGSGLPFVPASPTRGAPKVTFAAPLPVGVASEGEIFEFFLGERLPVARVRSALAPRLPEGLALREIRDVWVGAPGVASLARASDTRVELELELPVAEAPATPGAPPEVRARIERAVARLLDARQLPRTRTKGGTERRYDLRPLVAALTLAEEDGTLVLRMRLRHDQERGVGRPDEVLAVLRELTGTELPARAIVRERILLDEETGDPDR